MHLDELFSPLAMMKPVYSACVSAHTFSELIKNYLDTCMILGAETAGLAKYQLTSLASR